MNIQQLEEKFQGLTQFQSITISKQQLDSILPTLTSLLDLPFDQIEYEQKHNLKSVYYTKSKRDPRCLLLVDFSGTYYSPKNLVVMIRYPQHHKEIETLLRTVTSEPIENTLI